jgi:hypothetical protein
MVVIRILGWNPERGGTNWSPWHVQELEGRLKNSLSLGRIAAKRLAREIRDGKCNEIVLNNAPDRFAAHSFRQFLESLGAEIIVEEL